MSDRQRQDAGLARQGRVVAVVIALSGLVALLAPWIAARLGWTLRGEMLLYLAAMGGFAWALIVTVGLWRRRK
jgi:hypothetical protein